MSEGQPIEIIPGVKSVFTETGIDGDVINAWMIDYTRALLGRFDALVPVQHYGEYFREQDQIYEKIGKPGLFEATMESSNPETVAAFDRLVDEFNANLAQIKERKDSKEVQAFLERVKDLKKKPNEILTSGVAGKP